LFLLKCRPNFFYYNAGDLRCQGSGKADSDRKRISASGTGAPLNNRNSSAPHDSCNLNEKEIRTKKKVNEKEIRTKRKVNEKERRTKRKSYNHNRNGAVSYLELKESKGGQE
jgi:hypothetical protein